MKPQRSDYMGKTKKTSKKHNLKNKAKKPCKKAKTAVKGKNKVKNKIKIKLIIRKSKKSLKSKPAIEAKETALKKKGIDLELKQLHATLSQAHARRFLIETGGENALAIVRSFSENLSDEEISKRLKLRISDVRATLNRLHNEGLVNYLRERDSESGWYSYTWTLNKARISQWIEERSKANGIHLENNGDHYFCPACGAESVTPFESAVEKGFKCPNCSRSLEFLDEAKMDELSNRDRARK